MAVLELWALLVLLHMSRANLCCDNVLRLFTKVNDLENDVKTLMAERIELKNKVERLSANRSAVAFTARFSSDDMNGVTLGTEQILKLDHVITNIGGGYDKRTGIFSAPFAGVYVFFLTTMASNERGHIYLAIDKHGTLLDTVFAGGDQDLHDQGSTQVTTHLTTGEQVWVRQYIGIAVRGGPWTIFTGYLISID